MANLKLLATINRRNMLYLSILFCLLLIALSWWLLGRKTSPPPSSPNTDNTIVYSTDKPDEKKPDKQTYDWNGKADEPRYISLPTIGAEGFIQKVGVDQNKQIAVPNNVHLGGWFVDSVKPGSQGLSIIDGHVDGRSSDGIFLRLAELQAGDEFSIERGDSTVIRYRVKEIITVNTDQAAARLFSQDPSISKQLNLITCGGTYNEQAGGYDKRVIAVGEQI